MQKTIISVSQLNRTVKGLIEQQFGSVWVEGEISNFSRPSSGHWYFTLKDERSQVRCAMFRGSNLRLRFQPDNGQKILIRAKASLYEARGDYQLIAEHMEPAGQGDLFMLFEQRKAQLAKEGLFKQDFKQSLPDFSQHIAVITSPTGAAIRDILTVLKRRFPALRVSIYPVAVQGAIAAPQICQALRRINEETEHGNLDIDAVIVGRGGGSIEDLWAFNEESVARAIFDSEIPVISAVGHEVDFTIADFVADIRAATPSAAAELVSPSQQNIQQTLSNYQNQLFSLINNKLRKTVLHIEHLKKRLRHPGSRLREQQQRLDDIEIRLKQAWLQQLQSQKHKAALMNNRLIHCHPAATIEEAKKTVNRHFLELQRNLQQLMKQYRQSQQQLAHRLHTISPLATLDRGYAIATDADNHIITTHSQLKKDDTFRVKLASGSIEGRVIKTIASKDRSAP